MNTAAPMANGVATIADKKVTINEPVIIGNALPLVSHLLRFGLDSNLYQTENQIH